MNNNLALSTVQPGFIVKAKGFARSTNLSRPTTRHAHSFANIVVGQVAKSIVKAWKDLQASIAG
jgi:hypothetical protein